MKLRLSVLMLALCAVCTAAEPALAPDAADIAGFETFMERFKKGLGI